MRSTTFLVGTEAAERAETSCQRLSDPAWKPGCLLHWARENILWSRAWLTALLFMINSRKLKDPVIVISGLSGKGEISDARTDIQYVENKSYSWNHPLSSKHVRISSSTLFAPSLQPPQVSLKYSLIGLHKENPIGNHRNASTKLSPSPLGLLYHAVCWGSSIWTLV